MHPQHLLLTSVSTMALLAGSAQGTLLETDFDSLSTGAVTAANLDSVTTGGTWSLNTGRVSSG